jgi:hypothetical protein
LQREVRRNRKGSRKYGQETLVKSIADRFRLTAQNFFALAKPFAELLNLTMKKLYDKNTLNGTPGNKAKQTQNKPDLKPVKTHA